MTISKLSKQTIQDSIQLLIQIIWKNHCIESQTGNQGSLRMNINCI